MVFQIHLAFVAFASRNFYFCSCSVCNDFTMHFIQSCESFPFAFVCVVVFPDLLTESTEKRSSYSSR